ncbi:MAG: sulfotransferase [Rubrobacter sp.]|nr:sulfotransferase [Rubrobacter sp.]
MVRRLKWPLRQLAKRAPAVANARNDLARRYHEVLLKGAEARGRLAPVETAPPGVKPENMIWIFCISRSGSTWLRSMLADLGEHKVWEEPGVGQLFGGFYIRATRNKRASKDFILADATRKGWLKSIRKFVLDGARYAHPFLGPDDHLVIKEPDGSLGAPLLMEALPESRMVFLIRDPRDAVASALDAHKKGGWMYEVKDRSVRKKDPLASRNPDNFVRIRSNLYLEQISRVREAYNAHRGRKVLVRYEDLRADTLGTMKRICSALEIPVPEGTLIRAVEKHSWERVPEQEKGEGRFYRKARPGGWREDLTPGQIDTIERVTAPLLDEFYPRADKS